MLKIGDMAPDFSLPNQDNAVVKLSDYLGKTSVVIFFYPKDDTPGCTAQSCSFRDRSDEFAKLGVQILGISQDSAESHQKFIGKYQLPYPLLSDVNGSVATLFGVSKTFGLMPGRATFLVDIHGAIQMAYSSQIYIQKHIDDALQVARRLPNAVTPVETPV